VLQDEALGVHLFVVTGGEHRDTALAFLRDVWHECGRTLGMTDAVEGVGVGVEPENGWESVHDGTASATRGLVAARKRPGPGLHQAALRHGHDALCLSVMLAPDAGEGLGWRELDALWSRIVPTLDAVERPDRGVLGITRLYLARLTAPDALLAPEPDRGLASIVRERVPAHPAAPDGWQNSGVIVPQGFAVWEASAAHDARAERRLAVVAAQDRDPELTAWTWTTRARDLPPLARYLLNAAKLRYQLRVWATAEAMGQLRRETDAAISRLLATTDASPPGPGRQAELLEASRALVDLQARERGLVDRATRCREMSRTVEIAASNLTTLGGDPAIGGLFADDRALADWFLQRLDDEVTYLEAALRRSERVGTLADQLVQRDMQRRQESVNLGLTGAIGAILMSLAAVQSLEYTVPLPGVVKPAVVSTLGVLALLAPLVVLRVVVPEWRWSLVLLRASAAALGGALAWVAVSAVGGSSVGASWTWACAGAGMIAGLAVAVAAGRDGRRE
jgi:hypothetical protein